MQIWRTAYDLFLLEQQQEEQGEELDIRQS